MSERKYVIIKFKRRERRGTHTCAHAWQSSLAWHIQRSKLKLALPWMRTRYNSKPMRKLFSGVQCTCVSLANTYFTHFIRRVFGVCDGRREIHPACAFYLRVRTCVRCVRCSKWRTEGEGIHLVGDADDMKINKSYRIRRTSETIYAGKQLSIPKSSSGKWNFLQQDNFRGLWFTFEYEAFQTSKWIFFRWRFPVDCVASLPSVLSTRVVLPLRWLFPFLFVSLSHYPSVCVWCK